jgi:putative phage-type endonuclease
MTNSISTLELSHDDWLKARKQGIGSSDVPAILGLNPYKSPLDVYNEKISEEIIETPENDAMHFGNVLEQVVADEFTRRTQRKVIRDNKIRIHPIKQFMLCNLDRIILPSNGEGRGVLECKTASSYARKAWGDTQIPLSYFAQVQHQLNVTGLQWGILALLVDGRTFESFDIALNPEYLAMQDKILTDFWFDNVLGKMPPPPTVADLEVLQSAVGSVIEADESVLSDVDLLAEKRAQAKALDAEVTEVEERVKLYVGIHEGLAHSGRILATWKSSRPSVTIDVKRLREEDPQLAEKYSVTKPGSRRFLLKTTKEG